MSRFDITVVGISFAVEHRLAASATRGYVGEPMMTSPTYTTGTSDVNTITVCTDNTPLIGTSEFKGVLAEDMKVNSAGTVIAQRINVRHAIPYATRLRGRVETAANIDTDAELIGVLQDFTRFHLASSAYRFQAGGESDAGAFQIVQGNTTKGTVDVFVDARAMRSDVTA